MSLPANAKLMPVKTVFTGMACANCMNPSSTSSVHGDGCHDVQLFQCSKCHRAKYCSKQCQKEDWKIHKAECKFLIYFQNVYYPEYLATSGGWLNFISGGNSSLPRLAQIYAMGVENLIRRKILLPNTKENIARHRSFIHFARVCHVCAKNEFDFHLPPQQQRQGSGGTTNISRHKGDWKCCPICHFGWCCCEAHYDECHSASGHQQHTAEICQKYVSSVKVQTFHRNHFKNFRETLQFQPATVLDTVFKSFPCKDWNDYFKQRCPNDYSMSRSGTLHPEFLPASTKLLSPPLTSLYAMYIHGIKHFQNLRELTIHVVGPSHNFELEPTNVWEEITHCLPCLKSLHVVFVGPDACRGWVSKSNKMGPICNEPCPDCTSRNRVFISSFFAMTYHDYKARPDFTAPQLVVAFNTGIHEEITESWKMSLDVILDLKVRAMFTSYNQEEAEEDYELLELMEAKLTTPMPVLNPFRNEQIEIEAIGNNGFFQHSMYCMAFQGRS